DELVGAAAGGYDMEHAPAHEVAGVIDDRRGQVAAAQVDVGRGEQGRVVAVVFLADVRPEVVRPLDHKGAVDDVVDFVRVDVAGAVVRPGDIGARSRHVAI